jgi:bifunctional ADP-heptose synthase (sugar kinase/adenylyltransferase)
MLKKKVQQFIKEAGRLRVLVIGETIIDEFIPVSYEGQSMKSNCPVFKLNGKAVRHQGGASAIAGHLRGFVKQVDLISNSKNEIIKTRYMDKNDGAKHVEINNFNTAKFGKVNINTKKYDVVIVADFGHGFCNDITANGSFHLMCQTNSNNFGFNRVSKWKKYSKESVCIDLREASLQMNSHMGTPSDKDIYELYSYEINAADLFVTTGKAGSIYTDGQAIFRQASFPSQIVDTICAGDSFFAFSSLISKCSSAKGEYLVIPSLAASLSTTWLANENSVTPTSLLKYADNYL